MKTQLFTSESVTEGHPDKICDQISDAVLDAIIAQDENCRVACETTVTTGIATITASEIAVRLGATWLPVEDVQDFMFDILDTPRYAQWNIKVHFSKFTSEWNIEGKNYDRNNVKAYSTYGTQRINA